jgi:tetratricopeptide (TPR) repeat protein
MPLLDQEKYDKVVEKREEAVTAIKSQDVETFIQKAEEGWAKFPEPKNTWNQGYNYAKTIFRHLLNNRRLDEAKIWLNRMVDNNNTLQLFDREVTFNVGKYYFEKGEYKKALERWQEVVKDTGFRYFESEKKEYLDFYTNPDKRCSRSVYIRKRYYSAKDCRRGNYPKRKTVQEDGGKQRGCHRCALSCW